MRAISLGKNPVPRNGGPHELLGPRSEWHTVRGQGVGQVLGCTHSRQLGEAKALAQMRTPSSESSTPISVAPTQSTPGRIVTSLDVQNPESSRQGV